MQTLYVPKYNLHYRVNPRNPRELQWSRKPFGPATQWQHAMSFKNPIRALDLDDETKQGVVVLNDSTTYVGSGVRTWGRKFYPAGTRIYSLYAIGESKMKHKLKIKVHEHRNEASATQTKEWKSLVKLVTNIVSQAEIDSKRCYEAFKTEHPNDGACWIILGNPPIRAMDVWSVQGIGSITWHTVPFTYKGDYGTYTDTDRQTTINALTSEVYYSTNAMGRTFFERYPNPTEDDVRYWFKVPRNIKAFIGYDGTNYVYSASVADAERASVRTAKTLRKATPEEIKDKSIAWSMEGEDKYGRRMVNYRLGIWRPLTETEFYGSGTVD